MKKFFGLIYRFFSILFAFALLFWRIFYLLDRRTDLERLVRWAKHKRLKGQERWYRLLLADTERLLSTHNMRHPLFYSITIFFYEITSSFAPKRYYIRRGAAAKYSVRRTSERPFLSFSWRKELCQTVHILYHANFLSLKILQTHTILPRLTLQRFTVCLFAPIWESSNYPLNQPDLLVKKE